MIAKVQEVDFFPEYLPKERPKGINYVRWSWAIILICICIFIGAVVYETVGNCQTISTFDNHGNMCESTPLNGLFSFPTSNLGKRSTELLECSFNDLKVQSSDLATCNSSFEQFISNNYVLTEFIYQSTRIASTPDFPNVGKTETRYVVNADKIKCSYVETHFQASFPSPCWTDNGTYFDLLVFAPRYFDLGQEKYNLTFNMSTIDFGTKNENAFFLTTDCNTTSDEIHNHLSGTRFDETIKNLFANRMCSLNLDKRIAPYYCRSCTSPISALGIGFSLAGTAFSGLVLGLGAIFPYFSKIDATV